MLVLLLPILFLLIAIVSVLGGISSLKNRNFFAVGFSGVSVLVFGFFSIATFWSYFVHDQGLPL